jgi:hypothetical protein
MLSQGCTMLLAAFFYKFPPEHGLPMILLPPFPVDDHLGTKKQVLVKGICNALGKLKTLEIPLSIAEICPETLKARPCDAGRKQLHDSPGQNPWIKRRTFREIRKEFSKYLMDKVVWERKPAVCAYTLALGKLHGYPPLHTPALDHNDFCVKW